MSLEEQAIQLFPYFGTCPWMKRKIEWKRSEWVKKQLLQSVPNTSGNTSDDDKGK